MGIEAMPVAESETDTSADSSGLNPAQLEAQQLLREPRDGRPLFEEDLRSELRRFLAEELADLAAGLTQPLIVTKHLLASVHGCEGRHVEETLRPFTISAAAVRGTVAHKAIELSVSARGHSPGRLVDRAMTRLTDAEVWLSEWLRDADDLDRAEVRNMATDVVTKFLECFPPLRSGWRPVAESRWSAELHDGQILLKGKADLTIGTADGRRAGKVVVDFKTGSRAPTHIEDQRFYALLETMRLGVPPWKVATYYLDSGLFSVEVVTESMLEAAARRVLAGVHKIVELRSGAREPTLRAGPGCSWCPLLAGCDTGRTARQLWEQGR